MTKYLTKLSISGPNYVFFTKFLLFRIEPAARPKPSSLTSRCHQDSQALLDTQFCEKLDCLIAASHDYNVYLWGFETSAIDALCRMRYISNLLVKRASRGC